jgi:hypothetical protein
MNLYTSEDYFINNYGEKVIPLDLLERYIKKASREIDLYVIHPICGILSNDEEEIIENTCCELMIFLYTNRQVQQSILKSFSINGVSGEFSDEDYKNGKNNILNQLELTRFMDRCFHN